MTDVLLVVSCLFFVCQRMFDPLEKPTKTTHFFCHNQTIKNLLWLLCFVALGEIVITAIRYHLSVVSCFKAGRCYLYAFIGIYALKFLSNRTMVNKVVRFLFFVAMIQSLLVILQNIFPGRNFLGFTRIVAQGIGNYSVLRIYIPADFYVMLVFITSFCMICLGTKIFSKKYLLMTLLLTGSTLLLSYNRTFWVDVFLSLIIAVNIIKGKARIRLLLFFFCSILILGSVLFLGGTGVNIIKTHVTSIYDEVAHYKGNFAIRFEENRKRLGLIKDNFLWGGPGFVYIDDAPSVFNFNTAGRELRATYVQTNDSGTLTWLLAFGLPGVLWVFFLIGYLILSAKRAIRARTPEAGLLLGIAVFVTSTWLTSLTTTGFTLLSGVVAMSIALYLFAVFSNEPDIQQGS
jgi:hypothetical protein